MRSAGKELAYSESDDNTIEAAAAMLNGRRLEEIELTKWVRPNGIFHGAMLWFGGNLTMQLQQYVKPMEIRTIAFSARATTGIG